MRRSYFGIFASLACVFSVLGQTRVYPQCHTVQTEGIIPADTRFVPMIHVWSELSDPEDAAEAVFDQLVNAAAWTTSEGANVGIKFRNFGQQQVTDERGFFHASDSLTGYPTGAGDPFRHPFPYNATTNGLMRAWMVSFRDALRALIATSSSTVNILKCQFIFDCEAEVVREDANSVDMLAFLAGSSIWTTWKVPGSGGWQPAASHSGNSTGQTLAAMYAQMVTATDGLSDEWPTDITTQLLENQNHEHPNNSKFMIWFWSVAERAREAVMYNAAYTVLHDPTYGWPNAKCSDYHAANYDALTAGFPTVRATDGWLPNKSQWDADLDPADPSSWTLAVQPQHYTQAFPRAYISPQQSAVQSQRMSLSDRAWCYRRHSLGQIDAPELYQISDVQWLGNYQSQQKGHWSLNPYVPVADQHPVLTAYPHTGPPSNPTTWGSWTPAQESKAQSRLALQRHAVESGINTNGGSHEVRLGPWLSQFISVYVGNPIEWEYNYRSAERENRMILGMLRAKNTPFLKFWFTQASGEPPVPTQQRAFTDTHNLVKRVWATTIRSADVVIGSSAIADEPDRLEYTLRDSGGSDRTIPVHADESGEPAVSVLEVVVEVPDGEQGYAIDSDSEINLEALVPPGVTGWLRARRVVTGEWATVSTMEGTPEFTSYTTPQWDPQGDPRRSVRRTFWMNNGVLYVHPSNLTHDYAHLILRVYLHHTGASLDSEFDLVQVIPVVRLGIDSPPPEEALAIADLNGDDEITTADLQLFIEAYLEENALADLNKDSAWDAEDVDIFMTAYAG